jgi:hypothetical protein
MSRKQYHARSSARKWEAHVKAQGQSGLSRAEYCRRHNVSYHALAYWQRKLHHSDQPPVLVQVSTAQRATGNPVKQKCSGVSIRLNNSISIELAKQFSPATLEAVLGVLERR